ncbi:GIY-YIG nuclease family protein [Filifactor alocis]|uniref:GIY-YIG nuclease family protein n=1 Tax=Filifactor alocis TaxID=143361 RepID=UPI003C6F261F
MAYGKSIELFLVNGSADSLITAELSNWNGKAIKIPRIEVASCNRDDITQAGVYFLFCKEDDGSDSVYIGEAENVKERLVQHLRDYQSEKEKYYWTTAAIFIGRDLNKALIRYLENRFVEIARACKRYTVLTKNTYKNTVSDVGEHSDTEDLSLHLERTIKGLGKVEADGVRTSEGFVVLQGSRIAVEDDDTIPVVLKQQRRKVSVIDGVLQEDVLFSSPSYAAMFVIGKSANGLISWKDETGRSLKDIENSETE